MTLQLSGFPMKRSFSMQIIFCKQMIEMIAISLNFILDALATFRIPTKRSF
jgi:hypothetical protein